MKRFSILLFGGAVYIFFLATFLYLVAFVGNMQTTAIADFVPWLPVLVPFSIDYGREAPSALEALLINISLILLFAVQHTIMARSQFKDWLRHHLPESVERSVFVLASSLALAVLFWQWRPMPDLLWAANSNLTVSIGWALFAMGFGLVLLSTFLINHFDLLGLRQVWAAYQQRQPKPLRFVEPLLYKLVRHPMYLGFLLAFFGGPTMTVGHALFAVGMTAYLLIGVRLEERDLVRHLGAEYERYQARTPMLIPGLKLKSKTD